MPMTTTTPALLPGYPDDHNERTRMGTLFAHETMRRWGPMRALSEPVWVLFMLIANRLRGRDETHVSQEELASILGRTSRTVRRRTRPLVTSGMLLVRYEQRRPDGSTPIFYALGPTALAALAGVAEAWPRDRKGTARPGLRRTTTPPAQVSAAPPAQVSASEPDPDLETISSRLPQPPGLLEGPQNVDTAGAEEEVLEVIDPEVEKAEIATAHEVIAAHYRVGTPDIVLPLMPGDVEEVAIVRAALRECTVQELAAASRGAHMPGVSNGDPSIAFTFAKRQHRTAHIKRARSAEQKQLRALAARKREAEARQEPAAPRRSQGFDFTTAFQHSPPPRATLTRQAATSPTRSGFSSVPPCVASAQDDPKPRSIRAA